VREEEEEEEEEAAVVEEEEGALQGYSWKTSSRRLGIG